MLSVFEQLGDLRRTLQELLDFADGRPVDDPRIGDAWTRCAAAASALGDLEQLHERVEPDEHERLRGELAELARLNALAASAAQRDLDRIPALVTRVGEARRKLSYYGRPQVPGASCDVAG